MPEGHDSVVPPLPPAPGEIGSDNEEVAEARERLDEADLLDEIRELREEAQGEHHVILEIPSYKGKLGVRYKVLDTARLEKIGKRIRRKVADDQRQLYAAIDTLIAACDQVVVRDPGHPACLRDDDGDLTEWRPIVPDSPAPVRFDELLAERLRLPTTEARTIVYGLFPTEPAIIEQYTRVSRWMTDTTREVDDDLMGE